VIFAQRFYFMIYVFWFALMATVTSININGLRDKMKMKELLFTFRSDIICIQETNWEEDKVKEMREEWRGEITGLRMQGVWQF